jgi:hypothetical protein
MAGIFSIIQIVFNILLETKIINEIVNHDFYKLIKFIKIYKV